jgi:hypothetical protein
MHKRLMVAALKALGRGTKFVPPIFEPSEHVFHFVALLVEEGVVGDGDLPIGFRRDADGDGALCEGGAEPRRGPCRREAPWPWAGRQHQRCALVVTHLPLA